MPRDMSRCEECKWQDKQKSNENWSVCTNKNVFPTLWKMESADDCEGFQPLNPISREQIQEVLNEK